MCLIFEVCLKKCSDSNVGLMVGLAVALGTGRDSTDQDSEPLIEALASGRYLRISVESMLIL